MVSNYPHPIVSSEGFTSAGEDSQNAGDSFGPRMLDRLRQVFCGLHGHDSLLNFEHDRLSLKCVSCGHESPGWSLDEPRPTVRVRGDARRHVLVGHQLIGGRRVA